MDRDASREAFRAQNILTMLSLLQRRNSQKLVDFVVDEIAKCNSLRDENVMGTFLQHARLSDLSPDQIVQVAAAINMNLSKGEARVEPKVEAKADLSAEPRAPAEAPAEALAREEPRADPPGPPAPPEELEYKEPVAIKAFFARVKARRAARRDAKPTPDDVAFYERELNMLEGCNHHAIAVCKSCDAFGMLNSKLEM